MRSRYLTLTLVAVVSPVIFDGCSARVSTGYRIYDPGYTDY